MLNALEITTKIGCINNCSYCPQDLLIKEYKKISNITSMSLDTFTGCIKKIDDSVEIQFTGMCEPFLNGKCINMIKLAAVRNNVRVSTTLIGMKFKDIGALEKINFVAFDIHLPASSGDNIKVDKNYIDLLKAVSLSSIPNKQYHYHGRKLHPGIDFIKADKVKAHSRAGNVASKKDKAKTGVVYCERDYKCPVLLPNGDIVLCCMDYGLKHRLGNLLKQDIADIYNSQNFKDICNALKQDSNSMCHKCETFGKTKLKEYGLEHLSIYE